MCVRLKTVICSLNSFHLPFTVAVFLYAMTHSEFLLHTHLMHVKVRGRVKNYHWVVKRLKVPHFFFLFAVFCFFFLGSFFLKASQSVKALADEINSPLYIFKQLNYYQVKLLSLCCECSSRCIQTCPWKRKRKPECTCNIWHQPDSDQLKSNTKVLIVTL